MTTLATTVEPSAELRTATELSPQLRTQLQNKLLAYAKADAEFEAAKDTLDALHADIADLQAQSGLKVLDFPGYGKVTLVDGGTTKSLDKKKLYAKGITPKQLEDCYTEKPKKGHVLVTPAGA